LVEAKEVRRVVFGFEDRQPSVVITVGAAGAILALLTQVVDIGGTRQVGLPYREDRIIASYCKSRWKYAVCVLPTRLYAPCSSAKRIAVCADGTF